MWRDARIELVVHPLDLFLSTTDLQSAIKDTGRYIKVGTEGLEPPPLSRSAPKADAAAITPRAQYKNHRWELKFSNIVGKLT